MLGAETVGQRGGASGKLTCRPLIKPKSGASARSHLLDKRNAYRGQLHRVRNHCLGVPIADVVAELRAKFVRLGYERRRLLAWESVFFREGQLTS